MHTNLLKNIGKSLIVIIFSSAIMMLVFLFSRGGWFRNEVTEVPVVAEAQEEPIEIGPDCRDALVPGDIYQGRRLRITPDDLGIGQTHHIDVASEFNNRCLQGAVPTDQITGGYSAATITYDVENLTNSFDTAERAMATPGVVPQSDDPNAAVGLEVSDVSVYDLDITNAETSPHALSDFPWSCNQIFTRRREGHFRGTTKPRVQERLTFGSYCCGNGWGAQEYLDNPPDSQDNDGTDPEDGVYKNELERSPEPDDDGDPRNGYTGNMTGNYTKRWYQTTERIDITFQEIPSTTVALNYTYSAEWPTVFYRHNTLPGGGSIEFYRGEMRGVVVDVEKGNGEYDESNPGGIGCDASVAIPYPFNPPDDRNWVIPIAMPCPPGLPMTDADGTFLWAHDEPFVDDNNNGVYDCPDPDDDVTCEDYRDTGNGYVPDADSATRDTITYDMGDIIDEVEPELTFNRQWIDIGHSPRSDRVPGFGDSLQNLTFFYPITNIEIVGLFQQYTHTECNCRPEQVTNEMEEGTVSPDGFTFEGCQSVFGDVFEPARCGYCAANQPLLGGGGPLNDLGYQKAYCEDSLPRATNLRWPPFELNTFSLNWEISAGEVGKLFDTVMKDSGSLPQIDFSVAPTSPKKGDSVRVAAYPISFFKTPSDMYFAWTMNGFTQQGLVAGAEEKVKEHRRPPDFVEGATRHQETREFYFAPVREAERDDDNDGMDDGWEIRYFGTTTTDPLGDPDQDEYVADDFGSQAPVQPGLFPNDEVIENSPTSTFKEQGRYMYITPGIWWTRGNTQSFIPPKDFNPEWFPGADVAPGLTNIEEFVWGTDPSDPDTDDDGYADGADLVGVGQFEWNYINQNSRNDYENRDVIGVIALGEGTMASQDDQIPLTQIICLSKTVYPSSDDSFNTSLFLDPEVPVPGEPLTITANISNNEVKAGFLTYDWKLNGNVVKRAAQGENQLILSGEETQAYSSGQLLTIDVTVYNVNEQQESFGAVGSVSKTVSVGIRYDSLEVRQPLDNVIFPFPSEALNDQTRYEAYLSAISEGIQINRTDDVQIVLTNIWDGGGTADNIFFEWAIDSFAQNGKEPGRGSGQGSGYATFTFDPEQFLPDGLTNYDVVPKNLEVIGRAVDITSQKEVLRVGLNFSFINPGISISEEGTETGGRFALNADTSNFAKNNDLYYVWKIDGNTIAEGKGTDKIELSYLQASTKPLVELVVSNLGGLVTQEITTSRQVDLSGVALTTKQRIAYGVYAFYMDIPRLSTKVLYGFLVLNVVFFIFYLLLHFLKRTQNGRIA